MARGDVVLIRTSGGEPGVRRVWDDSGDDPFVCLEAYWKRWEHNGVEPVCWSVGKDQVFEVDTVLLQELESAFDASKSGDGSRLKSLWSRARPYRH